MAQNSNYCKKQANGECHWMAREPKLRILEKRREWSGRNSDEDQGDTPPSPTLDVGVKDEREIALQ